MNEIQSNSLDPEKKSVGVDRANIPNSDEEIMTTAHTPLPDIDRYQPQTREELIGNYDLNKHLYNQLLALRTGRIDKGRNTLVEGGSREGKTVTIRFFARCLLCLELCMKTLNPGCGGRCENCRMNTARYGEEGVFAQLRGHHFHFRCIDCTKIANSQQLRNEVNAMWDFNGVKVIYLDEISRLENPNMALTLLPPMNDLNFMWIASGISARGLDHALVNRFSERLTTELPSLGELSEWLSKRCVAWQIDWDHENTLVRLAQRSNRIPGLALQPLSKVNCDPQRTLTREIVENFRFKSSGPLPNS